MPDTKPIDGIFIPRFILDLNESWPIKLILAYLNFRTPMYKHFIQSDMCKQLGISQAAASRAIADLVERKVLRVEYKNQNIEGQFVANLLILNKKRFMTVCKMDTDNSSKSQ